MRKTIVTALIALLIMLAFASCEGIFPEFGGEKPEYTADGQQMVTLKVNINGTAGSRSLSGANSKVAVNYAEVIFKDSNDILHRGQGLTSSLTVTVPAQIYLKAATLILVGRKSSNDTLLLGTGTLTADSVDVKSGISPISFTVSPLVADLSPSANSAFDIVDNGFATGFMGASKNGLLSGVPCFQVPTNQPTINASLTITGPAITPVPASPPYYNPITGANIIIVAGGAKVKFSGSPAISEVSITTPASDSSVSSTNGKFSFIFASGNVGEYTVTFEIPVFGFAAGGVPWVIKGGTAPGMAFSASAEAEGVALIVASSPSSPDVTVELDGTGLDTQISNW